MGVSNVSSMVCTATNNGVDINMTTDSLDNSESRTYVLDVSLLTPAFVGSMPLNVTSYDVSGIYAEQTGIIAIKATTPNKLTI